MDMDEKATFELSPEPPHRSSHKETINGWSIQFLVAGYHFMYTDLPAGESFSPAEIATLLAKTGPAPRTNFTKGSLDRMVLNGLLKGHGYDKYRLTTQGQVLAKAISKAQIPDLYTEDFRRAERYQPEVVLAVLVDAAEFGPQSVADIAHTTCFSQTCVRDAIRKLRTDNKVTSMTKNDGTGRAVPAYRPASWVGVELPQPVQLRVGPFTGETDFLSGVTSQPPPHPLDGIAAILQSFPAGRPAKRTSPAPPIQIEEITPTRQTRTEAVKPASEAPALPPPDTTKFQVTISLPEDVYRALAAQAPNAPGAPSIQEYAAVLLAKRVADVQAAFAAVLQKDGYQPPKKTA